MTPPAPFGPNRDPHRSVGRSYDGRYHGTAEVRGGNCPRSRYYDSGRFGRLFPSLEPLNFPTGPLLELGALGGPMDGGADDADNPDHEQGLPAGFTFLGQFIDHDITFDPTSSLERQTDPEAVANFRTPLLELDNVYGSGPGVSPHLYDTRDRDKLLVEPLEGDGAGIDVPRNSQNVALIGDPRNDENLIVNQLHLAFLRFHNAVVDRVRSNALTPPGSNDFETAQRLVRWHYQWMIVHEYLPHIVGQPMVDAVLAGGRRVFNWRHEPFMPVEFAVAAFRFGHTQVRSGYAVNDNFGGAIFPALGGGQRVTPDRAVDWANFFVIDGSAPAVSKRFDPRISQPLLNLPFAAGTPDDPASLAQRNLLRGNIFGLPSGQAVATAMAGDHNALVGDHPGLTPIEVLTESDLAELEPLNPHLTRHTPLWYYILRESDIRENGRRLGPVGGRIVAETFIGLLQGDRLSYLRTSPFWAPTLAANNDFTTADLLSLAGVV